MAKKIKLPTDRNQKAKNIADLATGQIVDPSFIMLKRPNIRCRPADKFGNFFPRISLQDLIFS
jgi:hypothetical protein